MASVKQHDAKIHASISVLGISFDHASVNLFGSIQFTRLVLLPGLLQRFNHSIHRGLRSLIRFRFGLPFLLA